MSQFHRLERVWQLEGIRPHLRLVLANLAHRADEQSLTCFPSAGRIAADTGMSRPGVQKVIAELAKLGLITVLSSGRGKGRNDPNRYRLNFLEMDNPVGHSSTSKWITAGKTMDNHKPLNGSPGWHEPLNPKETMQSADALALKARAPRRSRPPEPGESPKEKEERGLLEVAEIFGFQPQDGENDRDYRNRLRQWNERRKAGLA